MDTKSSPDDVAQFLTELSEWPDAPELLRVNGRRYKLDDTLVVFKGGVKNGDRELFPCVFLKDQIICARAFTKRNKVKLVDVTDPMAFVTHDVYYRITGRVGDGCWVARPLKERKPA